MEIERGQRSMKRFAAVAMLAFSLLMGVSACGRTSDVTRDEPKTVNERGSQMPENGADAAQSIAADDGTEAGDPAANTDAASGFQVVTGGFLFTLPEDLTPTVNEQGLILTDENMNYQMLVAVRDYNFDDRKTDKESFAENVRAGAYEITKDVEIVSVAGREFAYFDYMDEASNMLLAYSAADKGHTFANLVLRYGDLSDEEILTEIEELLATAEATDLPDTTLDDIVRANAGKAGGDSAAAEMSGYASRVEEISIDVGETTIETSVPEDFYIMDFSKEEENAGVRSFVSSDGTVDAMLLGVDTPLYTDMTDWVKESIDIPEDADNVSKSDVQKEQIGDILVYYQIGSYEEVSDYSGKTITYLVLEAVGELPQGGYLELQAATTESGGLNFGMVKSFFQIKEEE